MVKGEALERLGIADPFLEHLGRGLDEVPLDPIVRVLHPSTMAHEDRVEEVSELVEERLDLQELH